MASGPARNRSLLPVQSTICGRTQPWPWPLIIFFQSYGGLKFAIWPKFQTIFISGRYKIHTKNQMELVMIFGPYKSYYCHFSIRVVFWSKKPKNVSFTSENKKNHSITKKYKEKVAHKLRFKNINNHFLL